MKHLKIIALLSIGCCLVSACGGAMRCDQPERYSDARELPPVQVPDDLTPPDESGSLRIPQTANTATRKVSRKGPCLESPPEYFEGGEPQ